MDSSQYELAKADTKSAYASRIYGAASKHLAARTTVSRRAQVGYSFGYNYSPHAYHYRPWYYTPYRFPYSYGFYRPWHRYYGHRPYAYFGYRPLGAYRYSSYYGRIGYHYGPASYFYARPYTYLYYHYGGSYYW